MIFVSEPFYLSLAPHAATPKRAHSPRRRPTHKKSPSTESPKKASTPKFIPPTDIFETPATYNLEIALPGVAKENIDVEWVEDTKLVIKAHNKTAEASSSRPGSPKEGEKEGEKVNGGEEQEPPHKRRKYWLSERTIGEFVKEVQFPEDIDVESTSVRLDAGLLYVEVKKMEKRRRAKVEVEYLG